MYLPLAVTTLLTHTRMTKEAAAVSNKPATNQYILPYLPFKQSVPYDGMLIICYTVIIFVLFLLTRHHFSNFLVFLMIASYSMSVWCVVGWCWCWCWYGVDCCVEQQNSASNHPYGSSTIELVCSYIIIQLYTQTPSNGIF